MAGDAMSGLRSEGDVNLSAARVAWSDGQLDAGTRALLTEDARYFLHQSLSTPCLNALNAVDGARIEDMQGRRYLDFHGNSVHQVGYSNPSVIQAIKDQLDALSFCPRRYTNRPAVTLAKKLSELAPGNLGKVLFAPGGTSAIGMALKIARVATGRFKTISMWESFHGASLDAISIGGEAMFRRGIGPLLPGTEHVPPPDAGHCPFGCGGTCTLRCAEYVNYVLEREGDVGAVIAETVRCTPFIPPVEYWRIVREACDRHGALLILDEIPIGLGRTGKMFACEHYGIVPDILVIGKGLGGGVLPLAAMITRDDLDIAGDHSLGHYTHEKNPVLCAAGLATIAYLEEHRLVDRAAELGEYAAVALNSLRERHAIIGGVRGLGLLLGVELNRADGSRAVDEAERVMYACLERGLSFKTTMGNILTLTPPLTVTKAELDEAIGILDASLETV
ncbi:MAG: aspartate aminotransferase family protein [Candidatus Hydrogenedentota bacterium]